MRLGSLVSIDRFAVKSMLGESLSSATVGPSGIAGDRAHGLVDVESGKVASAKDPRAWAGLLAFRAHYDGEPAMANLVITDPHGSAIRADAADADARLSAAVGRPVHLASEVGDRGYDYVWEEEGTAPDDVITGSQTSSTAEGRPVSTMPLAFMAPGTFQDVAPITLLTTGALRAMAALHPDGDWDPRRFRSNFVIDTGEDAPPEEEWPGRRLRIGSVELEVTGPAPRCVMTTLAQQDLPRDRKILQTVARHRMLPFAGLGQWACLGLYANVVHPGTVTVADPVTSD